MKRQRHIINSKIGLILIILSISLVSCIRENNVKTYSYNLIAIDTLHLKNQSHFNPSLGLEVTIENNSLSTVYFQENNKEFGKFGSLIFNDASNPDTITFIKGYPSEPFLSGEKRKLLLVCDNQQVYETIIPKNRFEDSIFISKALDSLNQLNFKVLFNFENEN